MLHISTSLVERQNLTMRMSIRRFARQTNAHSKSLVHHPATHALHYTFYNMARPHESLRGRAPAQMPGLAERPWAVEDLVKLIDQPRWTTTFWGDGGNMTGTGRIGGHV